MLDSRNSDPPVLAIYGSPRKDGVTSFLQDQVIDSLGLPVNTKKVYVYDEIIYPCIACGYCKKHFGCIYDDSMKELYRWLEKSSLVMIASPLYFSNITAPMKLFIDRCQVIWEKRQRGEMNKQHQLGFFTSAGAGRYPNMFTASIITMRHFFNTAGLTYDENEYVLLDSAPEPRFLQDHAAVISRIQDAAYVLTEKLKKMTW